MVEYRSYEEVTLERVYFGAYKMGNGWYLTEDPETLMNGEDQILVTSEEDLRAELQARHPAPSDQVTYLRSDYTWARDSSTNDHGFKVCEDLRPASNAIDVKMAARSVPGVPISCFYDLHQVRLDSTKLNSNRGVIGDDFLVRYDNQTVVYDPELVASERVRIAKHKARRKKGHNKNWAKGELTWPVIKSLHKDLRSVLNGRGTYDKDHNRIEAPGLKDILHTRISFHSLDTKVKGQGLKAVLGLLKATTLMPVEDLADNPIYQRVVIKLNEIGQHLKEDNGNTGTKELLEAISMVRKS